MRRREAGGSAGEGRDSPEAPGKLPEVAISAALGCLMRPRLQTVEGVRARRELSGAPDS